MAMTSSEPALQTVDTDEGRVTVASIETLKGVLAGHQARIQDLDADVAQLSRESDDAVARAGWILATRQSEWQPGDRSERIAAARSLGELVQRLEGTLGAIRSKPHHGLGGLLDRVKDGHEAKRVEEQLESAQHELDSRYRAVAEQLGRSTGVAEADALQDKAKDAQARMTQLSTARQVEVSSSDTLTAELGHRAEVQAQTGFDALGVLADLTVNGIRPIPTSLVLKAREIAALEIDATLCRHKTRTQFVGGSQGVSIPLGHGLRYRVSSFRGHPVQTEYLAKLDSGKLVVTNQRLVFLGSQRDVSVPLAKLLQAEPYSDAVGIAREGKESKDIYLVANPPYLLFYLNWVIAHLPAR